MSIYLICDTTMMYWSTILANIATIITGISAFTALICLLRNACLKKKLNCNIFVSEVCKTIKGVKALKLFITFSNPSEMEKCLITLTFSHNFRLYPIFNGNADINSVKYKDMVLNEVIPANQSKTINCIIFDNDDIFHDKVNLVLKAKTVNKVFTYKKEIKFPDF